MVLRSLAPAGGFGVSSGIGSSSVMVGVAKQAAVDEDHFVSCMASLMYATRMKVSTGGAEKIPMGTVYRTRRMDSGSLS
jgi:hypothetical protein